MSARTIYDACDAVADPEPEPHSGEGYSDVPLQTPLAHGDWGRSAGCGEASADATQHPPLHTPQNVTTSGLRGVAGHWSLAGDQSLLQLLENLHQSIVDKTQQTNSRIEEMTKTLDNACVALQNVNNRFMALSNTQFVESRVYDDDVAVANQGTTPQIPKDTNKEKSAVEELAMVSAGLRVLEQFYDEVRIVDDSDSDADSADEDIESVVLRPKNLYTQRPLPQIIGSRSWRAKWHAGLLEEDSDSDSSMSKREMQGEEYSSSEESPSDGSTADRKREDGKDIVLPIPRKEEDAYWGHTAMSEDSVSNHTDIAASAPPQAKPTPSDFAAELARRLGGDVPPSGTADRTNEPEKAKRQTYTAPPPRLTDEPPPLDNVDEYTTQPDDLYSDTDDIFADLRTTNVFNKPADPSYGGLFDDLAPERDRYSQERNRNETADIFDDFADDISNMFSKKEDVCERNVEPAKKSNNELRGHKNVDIVESGLFDDDEDDIFADIGNAVPKVSIKFPVQKGGLFDDDEEIDIFSNTPKPSSNVRVGTNSSIQADVAKNTKEVTGVKKPVGGVSLFGLNQGPESIGAAILRLRKASTSSEEENKFSDDEKYANKNVIHEGIHATSDTMDDLFAHSRNENDNREKPKDLPQKSSANDVFDDLFAQATSKNDEKDLQVIKNQDNIIEKPKKAVEDDNFDDLFAQLSTVARPVISNQNVPIKKSNEAKGHSIFNDDDIIQDNDIFISTIIKTGNKEGNKDLFIDDDDLFSTVQNNYVKKSTSRSTFDDDNDDLFATPILDRPKNVAISAEITKDFQKSTVSQEKNLVQEDITKQGDFKDSSLTEQQENTSTATKDIEKYIEPVVQNIPDTTVSKSVEHFLSTKISTEDRHVSIKKSSDAENSKKPLLLTKPMQKEYLNTNQNVTVEKPYIENIPHANTSSVSNNIRNSDLVQKNKIEDIIAVTKTSKQEPIPKPKRPGDDFFDTILDDQPPIFEKPKEPKKSKNVNALFEDDSDDERLFLKKPDNLSTTISDVDDFVTSPSDRLYGLFQDEPPDLDISFENDAIEEIPQVIRPDILENVDKISSREERRIENTAMKQEDILDVTSKPNEDEFQDLEYIKTVRIFDEPLTKPKIHIKKSPLVSLEEPITRTSDVSRLDDMDGLKETLTYKDAMDGTTQRSEIGKPIGKLKPMNLNINVHGLLPGASPKKTNKNIETTAGLPKVSQIVSKADEKTVEPPSVRDKFTESTENMVSKTGAIDSLVTQVSFDKGPEFPTLLSTYSKDRAKIQVKRRPSTRNARKEAIRKSVVLSDFEHGLTFDETDNFTSSVPTSPQGVNMDSNLKDIENEFKNAKKRESDDSKHLMVQKNKSKNKDLNIPKDDDQNHAANISTLGKVYPGIFDDPVLKEISSFENKSKSKNEDIFDNAPVFSKGSSSSVKHISNGVFEEDSIVVEDLESKPKDSNDSLKQAHKKVFSSDDDVFDELFKPHSVKTDAFSNLSSDVKLAKNEEPRDLEANNDKSVSHTKKSSLFEDNLSDDDLFGGIKNTGMHKLRETKIDKVHNEDALFFYSDSEDLFSKKNKDVRKPAEQRAISNRGDAKERSLFGDDESDEDIFGTKIRVKAKPETSKSQDGEARPAPTSAEQVFDDPLSFFDD